MYRPFFHNIIYDGVDLSCYFDINNATVDPYPPISLNTVKIPSKAGLHYSSREIGERTIVLDLSIKASKRNSLDIYKVMRDLTGLLFKDEPKPLRLDEEQFINVIATDISEIQRLGFRGASPVTFTALDPYFYGKSHEIEVKQGSNVFWIHGDVDAWPVIHLTGASNGLTVTNTKTSEKIVIPTGITSTSKVDIYPELTKCTVNGAYVPIDLDKTEYFSLPPGEATLTISSGSGTLLYRERFL